MELKHILVATVQVSIFLTVFSFGLRATFADLLYVVKRPGLFARSLLAIYVFMPAVAMLLVHSFHLRHGVEIALIALALSPIPPLLPRREAKAGGSAAFGLGLMAWLALLAVVVIPALLKLLELYYGRAFGIPSVTIVKILAMTVLLPLIAGVLVRTTWPRVADRVASPLTLAATILLALAALALLLGALPALGALIGQGTLAAMIVFSLAGLVIGHILALPDRVHSVVLALSTACRHPAMALAIATANFPGERVAAAIILYLLVAAIVSFPYVLWHKRGPVPA